MHFSFYFTLGYSLTSITLQLSMDWSSMAYHSLSLSSEMVPSGHCTNAQCGPQHPRPMDLKLPTCPLDDFPNSTGSGRYERMLIKAQSSNINNMKSIYIFFRGNSIAHCSLVHMVWKVHKIGRILKWSFLWRSLLEICRPTLWFGFRKGVKSLLCPFSFHQNSQSALGWWL